MVPLPDLKVLQDMGWAVGLGVMTLGTVVDLRALRDM